MAYVKKGRRAGPGRPCGWDVPRAVGMRNAGADYAEIARVLGTSRQAVQRKLVKVIGRTRKERTVITRVVLVEGARGAA
jgi:hypothetical protein